MAKAKKEPAENKDDKPDKKAGPIPDKAKGAALATEVEAAFRKIAKEEIGNALGHTIV